MIKFTLLIVVFLSTIFCSSDIRVSHETKKIVFHSGLFKLVGSLRIPKQAIKSPLVILVHGDGYATRNGHKTQMDCFLRAGYACFSWDKPGFGKSTGEFSEEHRLAERTSILVDAFKYIKEHESIDPNRIGFWGISQAGYVMPPAIVKLKNVAFMIAVGCPAMHSISQTAYLIRKQLICEESSEEDARLAEKHFLELFNARTYLEYIEHAKPLVENPLVKKMGFVSGIWSEDEWKPFNFENEGFFNPIKFVEEISNPVLAFFGEKDSQIDPFLSAEEYERALKKANNLNFQIKLIPNADHDIILCETGCMKERENRSMKEWRNYAPEYLEDMKNWLKNLPNASKYN